MIFRVEQDFWRKCSNCKKPIGFKQAYQRCSVSTCNQSRISLVFCSVSCWSGHVPVYRHRDAWAVEEISPTKEAWLREQQNKPLETSSTKTPLIVRPQSANATPSIEVQNDDILVVVSKLKNYIKAKADMNTSGDVMEILSDKLRRHCDEAIKRAQSDGRKTVMARDF